MLTLADFTEVGALLTGHFRLSSGLHSDRYLQCARLLMWPERARKAGRDLARKLSIFSPQAVLSPAIGGSSSATRSRARSAYEGSSRNAETARSFSGAGLRSPR